ncbi:ketopantoate reductase C-terminal domain-containing protein [Bradyrhizobium sp. 31Argb]|uniref:ketopantoate reductase C-terminal domain-containing protein n=1 Tax=Bradyrhizobium sp. 31Argb TaxID=3141247 RepID=UPI003747DB60
MKGFGRRTRGAVFKRPASETLHKSGVEASAQHRPPETIARAGEGDETAMRVCDERRFKDGNRTSSEQRPSMGQDVQKGRRTEIEFLNGFVVREGAKIGLSCAANAVLTDLVKRVERNELSPDPRHITELRLN